MQFQKTGKEAVLHQYRKKSKNIVKTYQPIRLFSIVSEILENLISFVLCLHKITFLHNVNLVLYQDITRTWFCHLRKVKLSNLLRFCLGQFQQLNFKRHLLRNFSAPKSSHCTPLILLSSIWWRLLFPTLKQCSLLNSPKLLFCFRNFHFNET